MENQAVKKNIDSGQAGMTISEVAAGFSLRKETQLPDGFYIRKTLNDFIFCDYREVKILCC